MKNWWELTVAVLAITGMLLGVVWLNNNTAWFQPAITYIGGALIVIAIGAAIVEQIRRRIMRK